MIIVSQAHFSKNDAISTSDPEDGWQLQPVERCKGWVVSPGISLLPLGMFCIPGTSHSYKLT